MTNEVGRWRNNKTQEMKKKTISQLKYFTCIEIDSQKKIILESYEQFLESYEQFQKIF